MAKIVLDHLDFVHAVTNPRSAVGNYLRLLAEILSSEEDVVLTPQESRDSRSVWLQGRLTRIFWRLYKWIIKHKLHRDIINRSSPDISIVFHSPLQFLSVISSRKTSTTLIYDAPSEELIAEFYNDSIIVRRLMRAYDSWVLKRVDKVVVYGTSMQNYARKLTGECTSNRFVIHQNVDFNRISLDDQCGSKTKKSESMVFSGSLLAWHGVPDFISDLEGFEFLKSWEFHICGDGPELENAKLAAVKFEGKLSFRFHGFLEASELKQILEKCQIGLMPSSNWYGAPAKIFEYLAADCFVFAPRTPTIQDVFSSAPGVFLFEPGRRREFFGDFINYVIHNTDQGVSPSDWFYENYSRERTRQVYLQA